MSTITFLFNVARSFRSVLCVVIFSVSCHIIKKHQPNELEIRETHSVRLLVRSNPFLPTVYVELSVIEEQRINIKVLAKLGKHSRQIFKCFKQFGDNSKEPTLNK